MNIRLPADIGVGDVDAGLLIEHRLRRIGSGAFGDSLEHVGSVLLLAGNALQALQCSRLSTDAASASELPREVSLASRRRSHRARAVEACNVCVEALLLLHSIGRVRAAVVVR